jgi:hypothetical protein
MFLVITLARLDPASRCWGLHIEKKPFPYSTHRNVLERTLPKDDNEAGMTLGWSIHDDDDEDSKAHHDAS